MPAAGLLLALAAAGAAPGATAKIASVEARLLYDVTGQFSKNILDSKGEFSGWNTIIGEGDSGGSANDVLIVVKLAATKPTDVAVSVDTPLTVTATAGKKVLAKRTYTNILIPYGEGTSAQGLYLPDAACMGEIEVTARLGAQVRRAMLKMDCGE